MDTLLGVLQVLIGIAGIIIAIWIANRDRNNRQFPPSKQPRRSSGRKRNGRTR